MGTIVAPIVKATQIDNVKCENVGNMVWYLARVQMVLASFESSRQKKEYLERSEAALK